MTLRLPSAREQFQGFNAYYEAELAPFLNAHEAARRRAVRRFMVILTASFALAGAALFVAPWEGSRFEIAVVIAALGGSLAYAFVHKLRGRITQGLLDRICANLGYRYRRDFSRPDYCADFDRLDMLPNFNRESWEDEVRGDYCGADFTLCESHLKYRSGGKNKSTKTVFHGQLIVIDYHKKFLGETVIKRDAGLLNRLTKPGSGFQRVGLASSKFEKIFEAWSTDQVEARDLLDPLVLERFEELDRLFDGAKLRAAFSRGKLLLALETGDKLNMGSMFKPLEGPARVERILKEFDLVFDLIDVVLKRVEGRLDGAFSVDAIKASEA